MDRMMMMSKAADVLCAEKSRICSSRPLRPESEDVATWRLCESGTYGGHLPYPIQGYLRRRYKLMLIPFPI